LKTQVQSEEAAQIGSVAALSPNDLIYAQYREAGVIFYRGYTVILYLKISKIIQLFLVSLVATSM